MLAHFACVKLLLLHFTKPILRKKLTALQSTLPTPPPHPPQKMNKRYCVPSNKSQSHFQNNSSKWKHDWTCLGNNGFLTLTVTWDVQNVKKVFYFQKKKKQISRLHIHHNYGSADLIINIIPSKYFPDSGKPATDHQIWKNIAVNQPMTSKVQLPCRLMHR